MHGITVTLGLKSVQYKGERGVNVVWVIAKRHF